jgi:GT2 family glycosyltransferase
MDKVAVVILNWNGEKMLHTFLSQVIAYSQAKGVNIYVADNASTDHSLELLKKYPEVKIIELAENYGYAAGYNEALKQIEATYYMLLNSDVEVTPRWLDPLVDYMDAHTEVAACQPKLRSYDAREYFEYAGASGGYLDRWGYPFCRGRVLQHVEEDKGQYDDIVPVFWATGAALFIRSFDFYEVGGFDGSFFAHMEEIDLCWRLRSRGRKVVCIPQSLVYHVGGGTLPAESRNKVFLNFRNNLLMLYKNMPDKTLKEVFRIRRILDVIAAWQYRIKGKPELARAVGEAWQAFEELKEHYAAVRSENLKKQTVHFIPEHRRYSILVRKLMGKTIFK